MVRASGLGEEGHGNQVDPNLTGGTIDDSGKHDFCWSFCNQLGTSTSLLRCSDGSLNGGLFYWLIMNLFWA